MLKANGSTAWNKHHLWIPYEILNYLRLQLQRYYSTALDSVGETLSLSFSQVSVCPQSKPCTQNRKKTLKIWQTKLKRIEVWIPPPKKQVTFFSLTYHPSMDFPIPSNCHTFCARAKLSPSETCERFFWPLTLNAKTYTPETNMTLENHPFSIGNASSNSCFVYCHVSFWRG